MHGHWLKKNQISGDYIAIDIPPMRFNTTVRMLFDVGFSGFNVTIPHKEQALAFADDMSSRAHRIGAANTLIKRDSGKISADNTDGYGFMTNLARKALLGIPVLARLWCSEREALRGQFWLLFWKRACRKFTFAIEREHGLKIWLPTFPIVLK